MPGPLESAIPPHLTVARTAPTRMPEGFTPPYPSFVVRPAESIRTVVMAYLGTQDGPADLDDALADPDGPRHHDRAQQARFPADVITIGYWDDPAAFDRWFARHREDWLGGGRRWIEVIRPRVERFETIFGARSRPEGVATLAAAFSGPVREHGYWGSMRDRLPAAQTDRLDSVPGVDVERDGDRVRVRPRGSVCLIRSGQDWSDTVADERRTYLDVVEPNLRAGMDFLSSDDGPGIGCLANRYLTVVDDAGAPTERTFGLSWWRTLGDLERWAASHPTHLAIFGAFGRMVADHGGTTRLRLHHEVSVAGPDEQWFEYAGCRPGTGLLRGRREA